MQPELDDPAIPAEPAVRATRAARRRRDQKGQILVIFAGAMIALVALCAVVVDVAWYWTSNLKMQRAADAAALAGVVWLPGNQGQASIAARNEAAKNGYTDGVDGVTVTPIFDLTNPRRLKVAVTGPVGTLFARAVGINSWPAARTAKADYVLPVPMGSPQNYYGVGFYEGLVTNTTTALGYTPCGTATWNSTCTGSVATAAPSGRPVDAVERHDPGLHQLRQQHLRDREHERREAAVLDLRPPLRRVGDPHAGERPGPHDRRARGPAHGRVRLGQLQQLHDRRPDVLGRRHDVVDGRRAPNLGTEHPQ